MRHDGIVVPANGINVLHRWHGIIALGADRPLGEYKWAIDLKTVACVMPEAGKRFKWRRGMAVPIVMS